LACRFFAGLFLCIIWTRRFSYCLFIFFRLIASSIAVEAIIARLYDSTVVRELFCFAFDGNERWTEFKKFALWVALTMLTAFVYGPYIYDFAHVVTSPALVSLVVKPLTVCWCGAGPGGALAKANVIRHSARGFVKRTR
jgi:hypothetical protein